MMKIKNIFFIVLLLLIAQCTPVYELDFISKNIFILDSSAHEFEVETKQKAGLNVLYINGKFGWVLPPNVDEQMLYMDRDSVIYYEDYSVIYRKGRPVEVIGEWFNIKKTVWDSEKTHITIEENKEDNDRNLTINLCSDYYDGDIKITQKKME